MTDERLKIWLGFWKFILSSVVISGGIAIATTIMTAKEKATALEIQVNKQEQEYLTRFLENAMDDNLEKRRRFAQYFSSLTTPGPFKDGWINYLKIVEEEVDKTSKRVDELERNLDNKKGPELEQAKQELTELRAELRASKIREISRPMILKQVPFDKIIAEDIECPTGAIKYIWSEHIWGSSKTPGFPDDYFITLGCKNSNGQKVGSWISWYSSGTIIQRGELTDPKNGKFTSWYENGQKAYEIEKVNGFNRPLNIWLSDGTLNN